MPSQTKGRFSHGTLHQKTDFSLTCFPKFKTLFKTINRGWGWGGQLGHCDDEDQLTPKKIEALADEVIVQVACGRVHTCAFTSTGAIFTWGEGIGTGHCEGNSDDYSYSDAYSDDDSDRKRLQDVSSKGVVSVSAGCDITLCVTKAGEVFSWGKGNNIMLGHGNGSRQFTPKRIEALVGVKIKMGSCGDYHPAVCTEDGDLYTCGCMWRLWTTRIW